MIALLLLVWCVLSAPAGLVVAGGIALRERNER